jgi:hypothetical protein
MGNCATPMELMPWRPGISWAVLFVASSVIYMPFVVVLVTCPCSSQSAAVVGGAYLWAALQAQRIMQEYVEAEFRHHPSVSPVITIHLYSHRVPISIFENRTTKVDETLKKLTDAVKTANTTAGQALKKANGG